MDERLVNETYRVDERKLREIIGMIEGIGGPNNPKGFSVKTMLTKDGIDCLFSDRDTDLVIGRLVSGQTINKGSPSSIYLQTAATDLPRRYNLKPNVLLETLRIYII